MDYVVCSGSEYQLSDCYYDVHVAVIDDIPRTECAYCKYIPVISLIMQTVRNLVYKVSMF